jgi:hypothetical protein
MTDLPYLKDFDPWCSSCENRTLHLVHDSPPLCVECSHPEHLPAGCEVILASRFDEHEGMRPWESCGCGPLEEIGD